MTRVRRTLDVAGVTLVGAILGWALLVSEAAGGSADSFIRLILGVSAAAAVARVMERYVPRSVAFITLCFVAGSFLLAWRRTDVWGNPLGYANASAALAVLAVVASLMLVLPGWPLLPRILTLPIGIVLVVTPLLLDARAGAILTGAIVIAFIIGVALRWPRWGIIVAAAAVLLAIVMTSWLGASYDRAATSVAVEVADTSLSEARLNLWHDAIVITTDHPWTGVGWGGFATTSPLARSDEDLRFAHNEFLQQAAESGFPGLLLTIALFAWAFARLYVSGNSDAVASLGAFALAAAGVAGSVDYVLRFPAVSLAAAALVGAAQARRPDVGRRDPFAGPVRTLETTGSKGSN